MSMSSNDRFRRSRRLAVVLCSMAAWLGMGGLESLAAPQDQSTSGESRRDWEYFSELAGPGEGTSDWYDFVLGPSVFDASRMDLGDLRLYDAAGRDVQYALRVRITQSERQPIVAREFNRTPGPDGSSEVSLDLGENTAEHNEIELVTPGKSFRRRVHVDGSSDGNEWRVLLDLDHLLRFERGNEKLDVRRLGYSPSRFRYVRIRVYPDPDVDKQAVELADLKVFRSVDVPGEDMTVPLQLGTREAVKADGGPGSAWILDLGADNVPCDRLRVHASDPEFARPYRIEVGGPAGSNRRFIRVMSGAEWMRRPGEALRPLEARFAEQPAARIRFVVTDNRNPPLTVERAEAVAAARQIVFARDESLRFPLRLYYGNPQAQPPGWDIAKQLPAKLEPTPVRLALAERQLNPDYQPPPLPLTERWPWLIYVVLSTAALVLTALIVQLARTAIAQHDATEAAMSEHAIPITGE